MDNVVSAAALQATRSGAPAHAKDLLLLHTNGRMGLYIGSRLVCYVTLEPLAAAASTPYDRLADSTTAHADTGIITMLPCLCRSFVQHIILDRPLLS